MTIRSYSKSFLLGLFLLGCIAQTRAMNFIRPALRRSLLTAATGSLLYGAYQIKKSPRVSPAKEDERVEVKDFNYWRDEHFRMKILRQNYPCYSVERESAFCFRCPSWLKFSSFCPDISSRVVKRWQLDQNSTYKMLFDDGEPAGIIEYSEHPPYIDMLGVDSQFRRRGHADRLMKYALDEYRKKGFKEVCLSVQKDGPEGEAARNFYRKLGFEVYETDQYWLYLRKDLDPSAIAKFLERFALNAQRWWSNQM